MSIVAAILSGIGFGGSGVASHSEVKSSHGDSEEGKYISKENAPALIKAFNALLSDVEYARKKGVLAADNGEGGLKGVNNFIFRMLDFAEAVRDGRAFFLKKNHENGHDLYSPAAVVKEREINENFGYPLFIKDAQRTDVHTIGDFGASLQDIGDEIHFYFNQHKVDFSNAGIDVAWYVEKFQQVLPDLGNVHNIPPVHGLSLVKEGMNSYIHHDSVKGAYTDMEPKAGQHGEPSI